MVTSAPRSPRLALAVTLAAALAGCVRPPTFVRSAAGDAPPDAPEDRALVVFVMPSDSRVPVTLLDEHGNVLGQLGAHTWFTAAVAPGPHRFYAVRNVEGYSVRADGLAPGETRVVLVEDPLLANFRFRPAPCGTAPSAAIAGARHVELDPAADLAALRAAIGDEPMRMHEADRRFDALPETEQRAHTLGSCPAAVGGESPAP